MLTLGDEVCTPDSSRFWPADTYEVGHGQPSFDKQYVRDWATCDGLGQEPAGAADPRRRGRADARALRDGLRAARGRAVRRVAGPRRVRVRVLIRPKAGILDPQGQAVERALPALGFEGVSNVHVGRLVELDVEDASPGAGDVREAARQSADRGLRDPVVKFGVVRFPGSCDEVDALRPRARVGDAELLWHADADLRGVDAVDRSRRLLLRRLPARRRDRALRAGDGRGRALRAPRRARARHLQRLPGAVRGGLLSGALLPNTSLRFTCRQVGLEVVNASTVVDGRVRGRRAALDPGQAHDGPLLGARSGARRARGQRPGRAALRRRARTSTAPRGTSRASRNAAGNVVGLMPHPEHAVDPLTGSADGLKLFRRRLRVPA